MDTSNNDKLLIFEDYINSIPNEENKLQFRDLLQFVIQEFPQLETVIKWNQPMFLHHGTYIIAFNVTKKHINIAPERATMIYFEDLIIKSDIKHTKMFVQMEWNEPFNSHFIKTLIKHNLLEKENTNSFWR